ncbi:hypothetical protein SCHPADRAFT_886162 [Schizopora paradoxa]|uniref:Uncharacterized protein n=1 Tax=Schizopora paradoxa TaxID=27342 RepID=A0A0H2SN06_9AGAM|nr:hypothetical protein SCHPADRAFT_886162 [Schizopora paradoxa]
MSMEASIDSDATAPNLPGAGRTIGLFLDFVGSRLDTTMNALAVQLRLDPENVVRAIQQICQHNERPFFQRHSSIPRLSISELKSLKKLCKKLIEFTRSRVRSTQFRALEEIMRLCVDDPLVRYVLSREDDLIVGHTKALQCIMSAKIHKLWSEAVSRKGKNIETTSEDTHYTHPYRPSEFTELLVFSLKQLHFPGGQKEPHSIYIEAYSYMWKQYIKIASESPEIIEWSNINTCIAQLSPLALQHRDGHIGSESYVGKIACAFYRAPQEIPSIVDKFLKRPRIEREDSSVTAIHNWSLDSLTNLYFLVDFVQELSEEPLEDAEDQIMFVQKLRATANGKFDSTVIDGVWFAYCHLSLFALLGEHISLNATNSEFPLVPSQSWKWDDFLFSISFLETLSNTFGESDGKNRYCKRDVWATTNRAVLPSRLLFSPEVAAGLNNLVDEGEWDPLSTTYYHGPLLFRFQSEGNICIVDTTSAKGHLSVFVNSHIDRGMTVDVMIIEKDIAMWHSATRFSFEGPTKGTPYDGMGHFSILAYTKDSGDQFYVARCKHFRSLSCVAEGESSICVEGPEGESVDEVTFSVLVLRHDPSETFPPYPRRPKGAKDATGPLYWLRFWPDKDIDFPAEHYNTEELICLEAFLNTFAKSVNGKDSMTKRFHKLKEALDTTAPPPYSSRYATFWRTHAYVDGAPIFHDDHRQSSAKMIFPPGIFNDLEG